MSHEMRPSKIAARPGDCCWTHPDIVLPQCSLKKNSIVALCVLLANCFFMFLPFSSSGALGMVSGILITESSPSFFEFCFFIALSRFGSFSLSSLWQLDNLWIQFADTVNQMNLLADWQVHRWFINNESATVDLN